jgi:hypothetical protein
MTLFVFHQKMSQPELRKAADAAQADITKWFAANPKRRVCNAQLWYNRPYKIRKGHINYDIEVAYQDGLK